MEIYLIYFGEKNELKLQCFFRIWKKKFWCLRYFVDEMNYNLLIINDKLGCLRIIDYLFFCLFYCQVMGFRGGIGCFFVLFVGLVWLECLVSRVYFYYCLLDILLCIINMC